MAAGPGQAKGPRAAAHPYVRDYAGSFCYDDHFEERHVDYSNALHCVMKPGGESYHVGPMARYANNFARLPADVQDAAKAAEKEHRKNRGWCCSGSVPTTQPSGTPQLTATCTTPLRETTKSTIIFHGFSSVLPMQYHDRVPCMMLLAFLNSSIHGIIII